jgi:hypothetical protein
MNMRGRCERNAHGYQNGRWAIPFFFKDGKRLLPGMARALAAMLLTVVTCFGDMQDNRVDRSIERGLAYLVRVQRADGSFPGTHGTTIGVVGLVGQAFLAQGHLPGNGNAYGVLLNRCVDYMLKHHDGRNGWMGGVGNRGQMYAHAIGTLFLSEVSGMLDPDRQSKVDAMLPKAVQLILAAQQVEKNGRDRGGWRYGAGSRDSDMSVSGWTLMALRSARLNGAPVPAGAIEMAVEYVLRHHHGGQGSFGYQDTTRFAPTLTGAGILCLELCGRHGHPATHRASGYLMAHYRGLPKQGRTFYGMYYTAQGLFQMGGEAWRKFSEWMYNYWIPRQRTDGSWIGSRHEEANTPAYATALVINAFSVPLRQLPIYQRDETVDD